MLDELRQLPDTVVSTVAGLDEVAIFAMRIISQSLHRQHLVPKYSTIDVDSPLRLRTIKSNLTPNLGMGRVSA